MYKQASLAPIVTLECALIIFGITKIYQRTKVLGIVNVNPIQKTQVNFPEDTNLKSFYEPKPGNIVETK